MTQDQRNQSTYVLWVLFGINMMNFFDRQILAAVSEPIRKEFLLNDTQLGFLNTVFTLLYAVAGVPLGRLADRGSRTKVLAFGVSLWSLMTAASGLARNYSALFIARLGVGVGEASCAPAANSLIGDLFPPQKRARAISIFMLGLPIGILLSNLSSGNIAQKFNGWRVPFFIAFLPGIVLAVLATRIHEPKRGASEAYAIVGHEGQGSPYWRVLRIPTMWWIILSGALHNFNAYAVNGFLPAYLGRYHGLRLQKANTYQRLCLEQSELIGLLVGGWAADWISHAKSKRTDAALSHFTCLSTPCVYLALDRPKGSLVVFHGSHGLWLDADLCLLRHGLSSDPGRR